MDILFENSFTRDRDLAKDLYFYMYFRRPVMIIIYIAFAAYFCSAIIDAFFITGQLNLLLVIIPILYFALIVFVYFRGVNMLVKRDLELYGKPAEINIAVTEEAINTTFSSGAALSLNYDSFKKVVRTKKYIHLFTKTNAVITFKKDSFSIGTPDELLAFLKSKRGKNPFPK
jgi:hypothetical protein